MNAIKTTLLCITILACLSGQSVLAADTPNTPAKVVSVAKIWDKANHNAFTDLIRYKDNWYCTFREAPKHGLSPKGCIRVITSPDAKTWTSTALLSSELGDLRDSKLAITPDNQLMLTGALAFTPPTHTKHQSMIWFSSDGKQWSQPYPVGQKDFWLWRTTWHKNIAYGVGYATNTAELARLYRSEDGKHFDVLVPALCEAGRTNESSLLFNGEDTCFCLLRSGGKGIGAQIGVSKPPYKKWRWKDLGKNVGGPHMIALPNGKIVAAGRLPDKNKKSRTVLCWLDPQQGTLTEFLVLPSGGDTSYPGLFWHDNHLWISYYSSHEKKTCIYLAKVLISDTQGNDQAVKNAEAK